MLDAMLIDDDSHVQEVGLIHAMLATAIVQVGSELPFVKINDDNLENAISKNRLMQMSDGLGAAH
jgi:hypothetical protein